MLKNRLERERVLSRRRKASEDPFRGEESHSHHTYNKYSDFHDLLCILRAVPTSLKSRRQQTGEEYQWWLCGISSSSKSNSNPNAVSRSTCDGEYSHPGSLPKQIHCRRAYSLTGWYDSLILVPQWPLLQIKRLQFHYEIARDAVAMFLISMSEIIQTISSFSAAASADSIPVSPPRPWSQCK